MLGQRGAICGAALPEIMAERENCYVLTADMGHTSGLDRIMDTYPERFVNVGIAEQNLIGVAAGLAFDGNVAVATTFATFLTMRCFEQVRHNLGYQKANVKLLGAMSGFAIGMFGNTHYAYEDVALMRQIPNMTVIAPADATEAYQAIYAAVGMDGPMYLRLSDGMNSPVVYQQPYAFEIGKAVCLQEGGDILIVAAGGVLADVLRAAKELEEKDGVRPTVLNMHTVKPLDTEALDRYAAARVVFTVEEHSVIGGLGSAVAEYYATKERRPRQVFLGVKDRFSAPGEQGWVKALNGLDAAGIYESVKGELAHGGEAAR